MSACPDSNPDHASLKSTLAEKFAEFFGVTMGCRQSARLLSRSLDRELPRRQRIALRLHFMMCNNCQRYLKQLRFLHNAMARYEEHLDDISKESLSQEAKARVTEALRSGK